MNNIRYADETLQIVDSKKKLQRNMKTVNAAGEEMGLKINRSRTECMVNGYVQGDGIIIGIKLVKQVCKFRYLGSTVKEDGRCESEIE